MIKHIITLIWNKKKKNALLLTEIFFAFLILFFVFTFVIENFRFYQTPLGFETKNIWIAELRIPEEADSAENADMKTRLLQEVRALPEVESAGFSGYILPFGGSMWITSGDDNGFHFRTRIVECDEDYAKTVGINVTEGRWFNEEDRHSKYRPIVINQKLKEMTFKDRPFLDSVFTINGEECKIVGVNDHYKFDGEFKAEEESSFLYLSPLEIKSSNLFLKLKSGVNPTFEQKLNALIASLLKRQDFVIKDLEVSRKRNSRSTWIPIVALLSISAFLILNIALGLFGVLWYNISKRKSEIGLRQTVGASPNNITFQFVFEILFVTIFGVLLASFFAIQFPLMKIIPIEPINFYLGMLSAAGLILFLVLICTFYPSRQASKIHPALALHEE